MGTSNSVQELTGKIAKLADALADTKGPTLAAGIAAKASFEQARNRAGVSAKKAPVRFDLTKAGSGSTKGLLHFLFPAWIINNPTQKHVIGARKLGTKQGFAGSAARIGAMAAFGGTNTFKTRTRLKRGSMALGGGLASLAGGPRPYAFHPGTRGKDFFQAGRKVAEQTAPKAFQKEQLNKPMRAIFK